MKTVTLNFDPFIVTIDGRDYKQPSDSSKKRLDRTLVKFCEAGRMEMILFTIKGKRILSFEPIK